MQNTLYGNWQARSFIPLKRSHTLVPSTTTYLFDFTYLSIYLYVSSNFIFMVMNPLIIIDLLIGNDHVEIL